MLPPHPLSQKPFLFNHVSDFPFDIWNDPLPRHPLVMLSPGHTQWRDAEGKPKPLTVKVKDIIWSAACVLPNGIIKPRLINAETPQAAFEAIMREHGWTDTPWHEATKEQRLYLLAKASKDYAETARITIKDRIWFDVALMNDRGLRTMRNLRTLIASEASLELLMTIWHDGLTIGAATRWAKEHSPTEQANLLGACRSAEDRLTLIRPSPPAGEVLRKRLNNLSARYGTRRVLDAVMPAIEGLEKANGNQHNGE